MVDDYLVASVGSERGLDGGSDGAARVNVADDGAIFGVVAVWVKEWSVSVNVGGAGDSGAHFW